MDEKKRIVIIGGGAAGMVSPNGEPCLSNSPSHKWAYHYGSHVLHPSQTTLTSLMSHSLRRVKLLVDRPLQSRLMNTNMAPYMKNGVQGGSQASSGPKIVSRDIILT
jgi:hypothetical protein